VAVEAGENCNETNQGVTFNTPKGYYGILKLSGKVGVSTGSDSDKTQRKN
jgi:hypothetical protein